MRLDRGLLKPLAWISIFTALLGLYLWRDIFEHDRLKPPHGVHSFDQFAAIMPPPKHLSIMQREKSFEILWVGDLAGPFTVPSGPSCYQFDSRGELIDWTTDSGEGGRLDRNCVDSYSLPDLSIDEVRRRIVATNKPK